MSSNQLAVQIRTDMTKMQPEFGKLLAKTGISSEKFARVASTAIISSPDLLEADRESVLAGCLKAAQDGLLLDGREAALTVFNTKVKRDGKETWIKKAQYMPMVAGILKKVRNSGELLSISSAAVYEADQFDYYIDDNGEHITHRPDLFSVERGKFRGVYAIAKTKDGGLYIEVMGAAQVEQVRHASRASDGGPWKSWYDEMARKTVIRRLSKRLPMSTDLDHVIRADDDLYDLDKASAEHVSQQQPETPATDGNSKPRRLRSIVGNAQPASDTVIDGEIIDAASNQPPSDYDQRMFDDNDDV